MANVKYDIAKSFQRTGNFPLDVTSIFNSLADATAYVEGNGPLGQTCYAGQILAVVQNNEVNVYKVGIDATTHNKVLQSIGSGEGGNVTTDQTINIGDTTIPVGTDLTDALGIVADVINDMGSTDGKLTENIVVDGVTYATAGTPITTVINAIFSKIIHSVERDIKNKNNEILIPKNTSLTDAIQILVTEIDKKGENDGTVSEDVVDSNGDVIVPSGTTTTEAIQKIVEYFGKATNIKAGTDIKITEDTETGTHTIDVKGISNPDVITLDEKKTITLSFSEGGIDPIIEQTWGDYIEFTLPETVPERQEAPNVFAGWQIDADNNGTVEEPNEIYQPGSTVRIINITSSDAEEISVSATALWR